MGAKASGMRCLLEVLFLPCYWGRPNSKPRPATHFQMVKIKREVAQPTHPGMPRCLKPRRGGEEGVFTSFAGMWLMGWSWRSRSARHQAASDQTCRPRRGFGCWMARLAQHLGTRCWWAPSTKPVPLWIYVSWEQLQSEKPAMAFGAHGRRMVLPDSFSHARL